MDPRVKPEDDNLKWLFLFVIPAGLKRESISLVSISIFIRMNCNLQHLIKKQPGLDCRKEYKRWNSDISV